MNWLVYIFEFGISDFDFIYLCFLSVFVLVSSASVCLSHSLSLYIQGVPKNVHTFNIKSFLICIHFLGHPVYILNFLLLCLCLFESACLSFYLSPYIYIYIYIYIRCHHVYSSFIFTYICIYKRCCTCFSMYKIFIRSECLCVYLECIKV